jgi:hypothetical protein
MKCRRGQRTLWGGRGWWCCVIAAIVVQSHVLRWEKKRLCGPGAHTLELGFVITLVVFGACATAAREERGAVVNGSWGRRSWRCEDIKLARKIC